MLEYMHSLFNTEFNKILAESGTFGMSVGDTAGAVFNNPAATDTDSVSATTQNFKKHKGGIIKSLMQSAPNVLKTLEAQSKLWSGQANIGLKDLAEMIKGYNEKKALNALYGIIDYTKSKHPVLIMQDNDMIKTIKQQLLQKQNEKQ